MKKICLAAMTMLVALFSQAQEGLPVYTDYLTDNYYLLFPSMAGAANCAKIRATGRQQWFGDEDAPKLLTISGNGRIGESQSGIGAQFFADKNGYHSQTGGYLTYAHHILFSRSEVDLNMLSFGLSVGFIQYKLDETAFEEFDPILGYIEQSNTNLNLDFGMSYQLYNFYVHGAVKNMLDNDGINNDIQVTSNLRRFLFAMGNVFPGKNGWSFEPSAMFQYKDATEESSFDLNFKAYKEMDFGNIWGGLSYRRSLDGAEYFDGSTSNQKLQYISPLIGIDYKDFMFAYTYSYQSNSIVFNDGGFHQITLGYNFNCRSSRYSCNCPAVN